MKIAYLMQEGVPDIRKQPLSGAANHVLSVIQELKKLGHQVRLVVEMERKIYWSDDLESFTPLVTGWDRGIIKLIERAIRRFQTDLNLPYANLFGSLRFATACRKLAPDYDIYFERTGWLGYGGALASLWQNTPLILEVNGDHLDEFASKGLVMSKGQYRLSCFLMSRAARQAAHIVATGEGWRQKFLDRWDVDPAKTSVIENGSSVVDILSRESLKAFKPVAADGSVQIVYCGGFEVWHGIPVLVHAVRRAIDQGCSLQVTLIGSGAEEKHIRELIQQLSLEKTFIFTGHLGLLETAGLLAKADVGISPYCGRAEFSGLKLLDYKSAGLATIASGQNGQPDVIRQGHTGLIVPPGDESALSEAIFHLARDPQLIRQMGQQARQEAEQSHSWKNTAVMLNKLFVSILSEGKNPERTVMAHS
jgi:glycosyltransferase involved in cell wall biosynthesis